MVFRKRRYWRSEFFEHARFPCHVNPVLVGVFLALLQISPAVGRTLDSLNEGHESQNSAHITHADVTGILSSTDTVKLTTRERMLRRSFDQIQTSSSSPRLLAAIRSAFSLSDQGVEVASFQHPPQLHHPETVGGIPRSLAAPLGYLLAAVQYSRHITGPGQPSLASPEGRDLHRKALSIAGAIDLSIRDLESHARSIPSSTEKVLGCDVVNDLPRLCVGGVGANTYVKDAGLLVDLGGDDVYKNSAGGADPARNGLGVSVLIDISGNDRYKAITPTSSGARGAQGAGINGGVGFLVDAAGDDSYSISSTSKAAARGSFGALGQAAGLNGWSLFADFSGNDSYSMSGQASGDYFGVKVAGQQETPALSSLHTGVRGQAFTAGAGSFAMLMDYGFGDDHYSVRSHTVVVGRTPRHKESDAAGIGVALGGAALFFDGGGADLLSVTALTDRTDKERNYADRDVDSRVTAFGYGSSGTGVVLHGSGDSVYRARAQTLVPSCQEPHTPGELASVHGFGMGSGGFGGLYDSGGDDAYLAEATSDGGLCSSSVVRAMGVGRGKGVGVLRDEGGDDRYRSLAESYGTSARAWSLTQGQGSDSGVGLLKDVSGNDIYVSDTQASSETGQDLKYLVLLSGSGFILLEASAKSFAQASGRAEGFGSLQDLAGADTYSSKNVFLKGPRLKEDVSRAYSSIQGSADEETRGFDRPTVDSGGFALFIDIDSGEKDIFLAYPKDLTCEGTRGKEYWEDCGQHFAAGVNIP